ncbi:MAG: hypothetical protein NTV69_01810 [Caldilinea sp.]|nr:hypothetical protein [Caldilinea sp.]
MDALGIEWSLLLAQIVNFLLMIVLLRMFLYQPVLNMLNARKERIAQSMKDAGAQATRDAEKIAQEVRGRADLEATDIRMKAQVDASRQIELALADANKQIADLAILATEKLLGRELADKAEQKRFVAEFLADAGSKGK